MDGFTIFIYTLAAIVICLLIILYIQYKYDTQENYRFSDAFDHLSEQEQEIVRMTNTFRENEGLNPLKVDWLLTKHAFKRLEELIATNKFKEKKHPELIAAGGVKVSENCGKGKIYQEVVVNNWFENRHHEKNINANWKYTGVAMRKYMGNYYYCQLFMR